MTLIRVNPVSVLGYGKAAQTCFDTMHSSLVRLVSQCAEVQYNGPNAASFKREIGGIAAELALNLSKDMQSMATAVQTSTTNIANSLGGAPITLTVESKAVEIPDITVSEIVDLETEGLSLLNTEVGTRFKELNEQLGANLTALNQTDWVGNAKNSAVDQVTLYTGKATEKCTEVNTKLTTFINEQITETVTADV